MTGIANDATTSAISDTYTYNGLDQRVAKGGSGGGQIFTRAGDAIDAPVLQDWMATYHYGAGNELISEVHDLSPTPQSRFYKSDALGTTRAVRDDTGTLRDVLDCDAFGNALSSTMGNTQPPFGFAGKAGYQTDSDTGLMLLGHRFYDSSTGRFLSRDPVQDGYNWYVYCNNDPCNKIDPHGSISLKAVWNGVVQTVKEFVGVATPEPPRTGASDDLAGGGAPNPDGSYDMPWPKEGEPFPGDSIPSITPKDIEEIIIPYKDDVPGELEAMERLVQPVTDYIHSHLGI